MQIQNRLLSKFNYAKPKTGLSRVGIRCFVFATTIVIESIPNVSTSIYLPLSPTGGDVCLPDAERW